MSEVVKTPDEYAPVVAAREFINAFAFDSNWDAEYATGVIDDLIALVEELALALSRAEEERDQALNDLGRAREAGSDRKGSYLKLKVERDVSIITEIELRARIFDAEARSASALVLIDQIEKLPKRVHISFDVDGGTVESELYYVPVELLAVYRNEVGK